MTWRMPPLALIERPTWTRGRTTTMYLMYGYLFVAVVLLLVKAVQLGRPSRTRAGWLERPAAVRSASWT